MIDSTMLDLFSAEVQQQVSVLVDGLLALESEADQEEQLKTLMRAAHSLKGAARLMDVTAIERIAHVMEDKFVQAQSGKLLIDASHVDILLQATDTIKQIATMSPDKMQDWGEQHGEELQELSGRINSLQTQSGGGKKSGPSRKKSGSKKTRTEPQTTPAERTEAPTDPAGGMRISGQRLEKLVTRSSELLVHHKWLNRFISGMIQRKKSYADTLSIVESLRDQVRAGVDPDYVQNTLTQLSKRMRGTSQRINTALNDVYEYYHRIENLAQEINQQILATRMRPFSDGLRQYPRMVRDISRSLKKKVALEIHGGLTEVDRDVLDKIDSALTHLVRNAIDHGIESPAARVKADKPEEAVVTISARYHAGMLRISIGDDGAGVDLDAIRKKVVSKRLARKQMVDEMTREEVLEFMFLPEFSTKGRVSEISGRGVGLDVVKETVSSLKGNIEIETEPGQGTSFNLSLPVSVSVLTALMVEVADESFAFPLGRVERVITVTDQDVCYLKGQQYVNVDDERIGLISASQVLNRPAPDNSGDTLSVVVIKDYLSRYGLVVDSVVGQQELVLQSLDERLGHVPNIGACALLEDGSPTLILEVDDLVRSMDHLIKGGNIRHIRLEGGAEVQRKLILVVDDSITVREVERNLLESRGYEVDVAVDGLDGWNAVRGGHYDLIITDIDMPRMDGFELVSLIKSDPSFSRLPTMIVSYKDRPEDRRRGLELGADYYLTKGSFHDETLVEAVQDLIGESGEK